MGQIAETLKKVERGAYRLIILDALYRVLPQNTDENSNANMATVYNVVDAMAETTGAAAALVHHASKGNQSEKAVTDVGSGAGSISRAADTHLILRKHQEENAYVLDLALRSWPPMKPLCLRWQYPRWELAEDLDPADLFRQGRREKKETTPFDVRDARWLAGLCPATPVAKETVLLCATRTGVSLDQARRLMKEAISTKLLYEVRGEDKREKYICACPPGPPVSDA